MPPQPGMFTVPPNFQQKSRTDIKFDMHDANAAFHNSTIASTSKLHAHGSGHFGDDQRKDRKRRELAGRLSREMADKKETTRAYNESIVALQNTAAQLATNPNSSNAYHLRLYPLTLERSALLSQLVVEENNAHDAVQTAYEEERSRVEDEYKRGRDKVRERLLEGIEERRRRAREEKDGEGISDATLEAQSRSHITRKLRNKLGGSPPPSSYGGYASGATTSNGAALPATVVPVPNPNSLSVDELPSPFPLPLTASAPSGGYNNGGQKRRNKGGGVQPMALTGLGKAISQLTACKELEVDSDLFEIRRSAKRKRAAAANAGIKT